MRERLIGISVTIAILMLVFPQQISAATKRKATPTSTLERQKAEVAAFSDLYMRSLTNICDGRLTYYNFEGGHEKYNGKIFQFNTSNWKRTVIYYPAQKPTTVESLNNVTYKNVIQVSYEVGVRIDSFSPPPPIPHRWRNSDGLWTKWRAEYLNHILNDGFEVLSFVQQIDGKYKLTSIKIVNPYVLRDDYFRASQDIVDKVSKITKIEDSDRPSCELMSKNHSLEEAPIKWLRDYSSSLGITPIVAPTISQSLDEKKYLTKPTYKVNDYVNDYAGVINNYTNSYLQNKLNRLHYETAINVSAVTVPSLNGLNIADIKDMLVAGKFPEDYASIMTKGIIVIVAAEEGKAKIIVGSDVRSGLPWELQSVLESQISYFVEKDMAPHLLSGDLSRAIRVGIDSVVGHVEPWLPKVRKIN